MPKTFVFVDDCSAFCSCPTWAATDGSRLIALSAAGDLLIRQQGVADASFALPQTLGLTSEEKVVSARFIAADRLFLATSSYRFFTLQMNGSTAPTAEATQPFKYGKNMRPLGGVQMEYFAETVMVPAGKFLFGFGVATGEFRILKLFSAEVTRVTIRNGALFVLTRREFQRFDLLDSPGGLTLTSASRFALDLEPCVAFDFWKNDLIFLTTRSEIVVRSLADPVECLTRIRLTSSLHGDPVLTFMTVCGESLVIGNRDYTFMMDPDFADIKVALSNARFGAILLPSGVVSVGRKGSEAVSAFGILKAVPFSPATKRRLFDSLCATSQLCVLAVYLSKKAFKHRNFVNPVQLLRQLLQGVVLKPCLARHEGFKPLLSEFLETLRHWTLERPGKCLLARPRIARLPVGPSCAPKCNRGAPSEAETAETGSGA